MISDCYNTTFTIKRASTTSSTSTDSVATVEVIDCLIRPVTKKANLFEESNWGKEYKMWCDDSKDIKAGDIGTDAS